MPLILQEILAHQADVICLQEVDELVYHTLFRPVLEYFNYQGHFSVKLTDATREGCAIFWSLKQFQKADEDECKTIGISELLQQYKTPLPEESGWKECTDTVTELLRMRPDLQEMIEGKLGHVLQLVRLRDLDENSLLVANTHLFYHPMASHVRALQLFACAHQLFREQGPEEKPFLFCGDFNTSLTNCGILLMEKRIPINHRDNRKHLNNFQWETCCEESPCYDEDFPEIRLPDFFPDVASGYPDYPDFTHYVVGFHEVLDHILMSSKTKAAELRPLRQGVIPTLEQVTHHTAMPSPLFPSDHVSVVSDLEWVTGARSEID